LQSSPKTITTSLSFDQSLTHICAMRVRRLCMAQSITRSHSAIDTSLPSRPAGSVGADLGCCGGRTPLNGNLRFPHSKAEFPPKKVLSLFPERSELYSPRGTRKRSELSCATSLTPTVLAFEGLARVPIPKASKLEGPGNILVPRFHTANQYYLVWPFLETY